MENKVFISFKNTDPQGALTPESAIAAGLYEKLTALNIPTFFSNRTLLDLGESVYKEAIEKALDKATILIVIGSNVENITSKWVEYEWNSFHEDILAQDKPNGIIIPYFHSSIPRKARPLALRNLESFSFDQDGDEKIIQFVQNYIARIDGGIKSPVISEGRSDLNPYKEVRNSSYKPEAHQEHTRLIIQSNNTRPADMPAIRFVMDQLGGDPVCVLDMGCAFGHVTRDRFGAFDHIRVLGVDRSEECIKTARELEKNAHIEYECVDLESSDFEERMHSIMQDRGIAAFDVVFSSLVLHHLKDPIKLLMKIRKFIKKGGYIILRGSDDGSVIAYNDQDLVRKIIEKHLSTPGISDRLNGRKLYYQLYTSGYKDIRMFNYVKDVSGKDFDERHEIFEERFSYRANYIKNLLKKDPTSIPLKNDLEWMTYALDKLEELFGNESFWYQEIDFVAVARKN